MDRLVITSLPLLVCIISSRAQLPCLTAQFETGEKFLLAESSQRLKILTDEEEPCQVVVNALLVGSGGDSDTFEGHGGGSGYVDMKQLLLTAPVTLSLTVGRTGNFGSSGGATTLEVYGGEFLMGVSGGVGGADAGGNGGAGYSGGGGGGKNGYPAGFGGTDGGDGGHSPFSSEGGRGSGVNISDFHLEYFTLSPGAGGPGVGFYGGGGGGVLVSPVKGPGEGEGQGYGAGGGGSATKGVAVLEIIL